MAINPRAIDALVHMWTDPEFAQEIFAVTTTDPAARRQQVETVLAHHGFRDVTTDDIKSVADDFCALMTTDIAELSKSKPRIGELSNLSQANLTAFCHKLAIWGGGDVNL